MEAFVNFPWVEVVTAAVVIASAVVAVTPTEKDDNVLGRVKNVLRKVGLLKLKE